MGGQQWIWQWIMGTLEVVKFLAGGSWFKYGKSKFWRRYSRSSCCYQRTKRCIAILFSQNLMVTQILLENITLYIHVACREGHLQTVKLLIDYKSKLYARDLKKNTPLHVASLNGHTDVVKCLIIDNHCNPLCLNEVHDAPLHSAAYNGHLAIVKFYIQDLKCNPNITGDNKLTCLHIASKNGHINVVEYLTTLPTIKCNLKSRDGYTPLHHAVEGGHLNIVQLLIEKKLCNPNDKTGNAATSLQIASLKGHLTIVMYLISRKSVKFNTLQCIVAAIKHNQSEVLEYLINNSTKLSTEEQQAVCEVAADIGNSSALKLCLRDILTMKQPEQLKET